MIDTAISGIDYLPEGTFEAGSTDFGDWKPSIYFHSDNEIGDIPFWQWLRMQKEDLDITWREIDDLCDVPRVHQYTGRQSDGHPNEPRRSVFEKILKGLGAQESQFHLDRSLSKKRMYRFESIPEKETPEYTERLHVLGTGIRERTKELVSAGKHPQLFSCDMRIKKMVGLPFFCKYATTHEDREIVLAELHTLGYTEIELQHQEQRKGVIRRITALERYHYERIVWEHMVQAETDGKRVNTALVTREILSLMKEIHDELHLHLEIQREEQVMEEDFREPSEKYLQERTSASITYQISKMLGRGKSLKVLGYGSPEPHPVTEKEEPEEELIDTITTLIDDLEDDDERDEVDDEEAPIIEPDEDDERKKNFLENSLYGHQAIVAYLMHPEHYHELLGEDAKLIAVDFSEDSTPHSLFEDYKSLRDDVKADTEDKEVMDFVDGWIRCDMVFRTDNQYVVLEIKQFAYDRNGFKNAQKARQQIASYCGVLKDNLKFNNFAHSDSVPLSEDVVGGLVAFEIQEDVAIHLENVDNLVITLDKDEVYAFVKGEEEKDEPVKEAAEEPEEEIEEVETEEPEEEDVNEPEETPKKPAPPAEVNIEDMTDEQRAEYEKHLVLGEELAKILNGPDNLIVAFCDHHESLIEIKDSEILYPITSIRMKHLLADALNRGVIRKARIDSKKYFEYGRGEIIETA